ncbi:MAG: ATP-binding protein [Acidobacteriaceae bacterium]|nr:ATP-binding protein [Acidobacteriaceae bacterium]
MPMRKPAPVSLPQLSHSYATRATQIRAAIEPHRRWIESKLGVSLPDAVILYSDIGFHNAAIKRLLGYIDSEAPIPIARARLAEMLQLVEIPDEHLPLFDLTLHRVTNKPDESLICGTEDIWAYEIEWTDGPVFVQLRDLPTPVVAVCTGYYSGPDGVAETRQDILIVPKHGLEPLISLLKSLQVSDGKARLKVGRGPATAITEYSWDNLTLDPTVVTLLRNDFEMFFEREAWFRQMGLPFRRGYLLHGPPGCGKSSAIRAMISSRGFTAYTMRFFAREIDDADLDYLFASAAQNAPSLVVLEDIDRVFPRTGESKTQVSLQALLNGLDGIGSGEGIVTVATANEPTALDPAILKRPGRFDRLVAFPLPSAELRHEYFQKLDLSFNNADLEAAVEQTDGMSFAQLREIHIMAGQRAFASGRPITGEDLLYGLCTMRQSLSITNLKPGTPGFARSRVNVCRKLMEDASSR